ncbi:MAG: hypothetical protein INR71_06445 [Terriglobus roseus]|nr:hypothetical protein [Terriglobus roseus]
MALRNLGLAFQTFLAGPWRESSTGLRCFEEAVKSAVARSRAPPVSPPKAARSESLLQRRRA